MGLLLIEWLTTIPAFYSVSLYCFGPFETTGETNKRSRGKSYCIVITCLVSRAIYIVLSNDSSTNAFLMPCRRFISIRGNPISKVYSDSGSQLLAANRELKKIEAAS